MPPAKNRNAAPTVDPEVEALAEDFGFEVSAPPERDNTRNSKHADRWRAARKYCEAHPNQTIKVHTWPQASQPYNYAKAINNGEHKFFHDGENWQAVAAKDGDSYGLWLTYRPV